MIQWCSKGLNNTNSLLIKLKQKKKENTKREVYLLLAIFSLLNADTRYTQICTVESVFFVYFQWMLSSVKSIARAGFEFRWVQSEVFEIASPWRQPCTRIISLGKVNDLQYKIREQLCRKQTYLSRAQSLHYTKLVGNKALFVPFCNLSNSIYSIYFLQKDNQLLSYL